MGTSDAVCELTEEQRAFLAAALEAIGAAEDKTILLAAVYDAVAAVFPGQEYKAKREQTLSHVRSLFNGGKADLPRLRQFASRLVDVLSVHYRAEPRPAAAAKPRPQPDAPTLLRVVPPPPAVRCQGFEALLRTAIRHRIERVTTFFHRRNPDLERLLPPPFLLSPVFADRLCDVVDRFIVPTILNTRAVRALGTSRDWSDIDSVAFWQAVGDEKLAAKALERSWHSAWANLRQEVVQVRSGSETKRVLKGPPELKQVREFLAPGPYSMPKVDNAMLDFLASLIGKEYERSSLEYAWTKLRQIYEQEMDRRVYQDKARTGAFRDSLLECFEQFPDRTGEFLALLCYFSFPNMSLEFLSDFTRNKGSNDAIRRTRIPYLMAFLDDPDVAVAKEREECQRAAAETAAGA